MPATNPSNDQGGNNAADDVSPSIKIITDLEAAGCVLIRLAGMIDALRSRTDIGPANAPPLAYRSAARVAAVEALDALADLERLTAGKPARAPLHRIIRRV